jgi:hypothetical protein
MTILKKIFVTSRVFTFFTNLEKSFQKFLNPSTLFNELAATRTLQIIENGP